MLSIVIHALIFLIPVSMIAKENIPDVELFMTIEDDYVRQNPLKQRQEKAKPTHARKEPDLMSKKEVFPQERKEEKAETARDSMQDIAEPATIKNPVSATRDIAAEHSSEPVDTEFGAAIAPSFLYREMPVYPLFARKLGKEGKVVLRLTIDERGDLIHIEVVEKAGFGFVEAAVDAVRKSSFLPAKKDGKPVVSRALLPIRFTLRRDS